MSTLDDFIKFEGETFFVERTKQTLSGIRTDNTIEFYPDSDIKASDTVILTSTKERFHIVEVKSVHFLGEIDHISAKYLTETAFKKDKVKNTSTTIFNISNATNSVIGTNPIGNYTYGFTDIEKLIQRKAPNSHEFDAFLAVLKNTLETERCPKGILANFSDLLQKHEWLSSPIAQLLLSHFFAK